jgi:hypothetical protein
VQRGGFVVWRAAQWYPDLISHVFSVCSTFPPNIRPHMLNSDKAPYTAPHKDYYSTEQLVKGPLPQFAYQLHLASGEVEKSVNDETTIRQFLKGTYGAKGPNGELVFDPEKGIIASNLSKVGESRILNGEVSGLAHNQHDWCNENPVLTKQGPRLLRRPILAPRHPPNPFVPVSPAKGQPSQPSS